jgi:hypothetical protein
LRKLLYVTCQTVSLDVSATQCPESAASTSLPVTSSMAAELCHVPAPMGPNARYQSSTVSLPTSAYMNA